MFFFNLYDINVAGFLKYRCSMLNQLQFFRGVLLFLFLFFYSCGTVAPLKEKEAAAFRLQEAKSLGAKAEKTNQKNLNLAENLYAEGNKLIVTNSKSSKNKKALAKYKESEKISLMVWSNTVSLYTREKIDQLSQLQKKAGEIKLFVLYREDYGKVSNQIIHFEDKHKKKNYREIIDTIDQEIENYQVLITNIDALIGKNKLAEEDVIALTNSANDLKVSAALPAEKDTLLAKLSNAQSLFSEGEYKKSLLAYKEEVTNWQQIIEELKILKRNAEEDFVDATSDYNSLVSNEIEINKKIKENESRPLEETK